ncbi:hypothetical protein [Azospirillum sp. TSH64]|uniref:ORC-CDC6 family AAA ATPase n=1 Tax=Azospirillum sp. TSH64 TaxID=652740 RepID=UPI0011B23156|nr:hypothetical protein [Azospirillum sp. TSH64]
MPAASIAEKLSDLFGSYKAEWLRESIFELFTVPAYFPELTTARPCVLIGGRGTGKTTVLRMLSYEGQFALHKEKIPVSDWRYIGMYYRVNTNRVTAFSGDKLPESEWRRLFGHYINLILCGLGTKMLKWYRSAEPGREVLPAEICQEICESLCLPNADSEDELDRVISKAKSSFEAYLNNIGQCEAPRLSMQGAPVDLLFESLGKLSCFKNKLFFFLMDEYENFLDDQQRTVNTLIKHAGAHYTFKIGVRELGWRIRITHNQNEVLNSPADYVRVAISERLDDDMFGRFAQEVCNARIRMLKADFPEMLGDVFNLLPGMSDEEEARLLGVKSMVADLRDQIKNLSTERRKNLEDLDDLRLYFCAYWARGQNRSISMILNEMAENPGAWERRFQEYKYASLFTIRPRTTGITKYYCGWPVFVSLSGKNIRYLLELIDHSLLLHLRDGRAISEPVSFKNQTVAAQNVGRKNLSELEGLSTHGGQLTKLLLGLGRVFGVMAADSAGHAPEVNQFKLGRRIWAGEAYGNEVELKRIDDLLASAVMHLACQSFPGTKRKDVGDTREKAYQLHPIFSPYFVYSHKKGRDIVLEVGDIAGLIDAPKSTIRRILGKNNRADQRDIPEQLRLFGGYYDGQL